MPTLSEFLFAPWKILSVLLGPSTPKPGAPPTSDLCYVRDVGGGEMLNVCRLGNYEMPSFVFWASLLIFLLFVAACVYLFRQTLKLARTLQVLEKGLRHTPEAPSLEQLRTVFAKRHATRPAWEQLEASVVSETPTVFSRAPDEIFSLMRLEDDNIQMGFFAAIPGILTGLGLLMTFIAILDGLSHVTVAANMDVQGISGLINGLSGKFVSSIVAVTCAVLFAFVEKFAFSFVRDAHRPFMSQVLRKIHRRTPEQLLAQIQKQLDAQGAQIQKLAGR